VLCVYNLSRHPQAVWLDLSDHLGEELVELTGGGGFCVGGVPAPRYPSRSDPAGPAGPDRNHRELHLLPARPPRLQNDRNQQELFTAMLLSLPGSPVLYYG
ncbi:hypothetical protein ADK67_15045, partial [Saccharothrix sp. NRRL B-16348]|uniref:hypothetical protein n=1 Tax=Saccharothrix sp. NRRL B-16348 TaxID=1415542 RepID=UPI0006BF7120